MILSCSQGSDVLKPVWIWSEDYATGGETNARFRFERRLVLSGVTRGVARVSESRDGSPCYVADGVQGPRWVMEISADSRYRLWINGRRVADGPARGYPGAPFFDRVEAGPFLRADGGENVIVAEVEYFGMDTFQCMRGAPGLWLRLLNDQGKAVLVSDENWSVRRVAGHRVNVPRISPQLGFEEHFDATVGAAPARAASRQRLRDASPQMRDVAALGSSRREFETIVLENKIREWPREQMWTFHVREHLGPFPGGINMHGLAGVLASEFWVECDKAGSVTMDLVVIGLVREVCVNGEVLPLVEADQELKWYHARFGAGRHGISLSVCDRYDHVPELSVAWRVTQWPEDGGERSVVRWRSPWVSSGPLWSCDKDTHCPVREDGTVDVEVDTFERTRPEVAARVDALAREMSRAGGGRMRKQGQEGGVAELGAGFIAEADAYLAMRLDEVVAADAGRMPVLPVGSRVVLDMGDITNGFFEMDIDAGKDGAGVLVDAYFFEHYDLNARPPCIQYMQNDGNPYRTSFRYTARAGRQVFLSAQRRGFRYVMLTVRGQTQRAGVMLHAAAVVESLYPVGPERVAEFRSSDPCLDAIFKMSQRTLHLCMEDTFTDCPGYEQTLWVGDARHEALFAMVTFGAYDLAERCARLVAQSHHHMRMPMAACQCPSGWDAVLPAFSFLWVISVSEIYWHTGREAFLREMIPSVRRTLDTALRLCTDHGLFSAPTWNFFEWASIDQHHATVLHNSLLLAGALAAGEWMTRCLDGSESSEARRLSEARAGLVGAISRLWNEEAGAFADAIIGDSGQTSSRLSQHTSFLALLFEAFPAGRKYEEWRVAALRNCLQPPSGMTTVGSPFAMFFLLETLLKEGHAERVLAEIRTYWTKMLDAGATTCWEMIYPPEAPFPTRSHCHGWSSGPVYLLPVLFFGIEIVEPGWRRVRLRPRSLGLERVEASVNTPHGLLRLRQGTDAEGRWWCDYDAPDGVSVELVCPQALPGGVDCHEMACIER